MFYIVGLGNPGERYEQTRHNIGRDIVEKFRKKFGFEIWTEDNKNRALISEGKLGRHKVILILPQTYMNDSGKALKTFITSKKKANNTIVVYDDLDLGVGKLKISYNKSSGGHKGIDSIIKQLKTKEFIRLRAGIAPVTPTGKVKKVNGEETVKKHVLTKFKPSEEDLIKRTKVKGTHALEDIITKGYLVASNEVNQG